MHMFLSHIATIGLVCIQRVNTTDSRKMINCSSLNLSFKVMTHGIKITLCFATEIYKLPLVRKIYEHIQYTGMMWGVCLICQCSFVNKVS